MDLAAIRGLSGCIVKFDHINPEVMRPPFMMKWQMNNQASVDIFFNIWKSKLRAVLGYYEQYRTRIGIFFPKLFLFFFILNVASYWFAIGTAFPDRAFGDDWARYFLIQFPVGFLGAVFDGFSFIVTVFIIRRALQTLTKISYLAHLSIDLVIALLATLWVLVVFSVSTWLIDTMVFDLDKRHPPPQVQQAPLKQKPSQAMTPQAPTKQSLATSKVIKGDYLRKRSSGYRRRFIDALNEPFAPENIKNIYFGVLMGASAMLPSLTHLFLSVLSLFIFFNRRRLPAT